MRESSTRQSSAVLRELIRHLRANRTRLRELWLHRILLGQYLTAMSEHALIAPEGDMDRRRHAHSACVARAGLPSRDDWLKTQPRQPGLFARLFRRQ